MTDGTLTFTCQRCGLQYRLASRRGRRRLWCVRCLPVVKRERTALKRVKIDRFYALEEQQRREA